jgi:hypothetical protein
MPRVRLPNKWFPRWYQLPLWEYLQGGGKRAVAICHRRWGKDDVALHFTARAAHLPVTRTLQFRRQARRCRYFGTQFCTAKAHCSPGVRRPPVGLTRPADMMTLTTQ